MNKDYSIVTILELRILEYPIRSRELAEGQGLERLGRPPQQEGYFNRPTKTAIRDVDRLGMLTIDTRF